MSEKVNSGFFFECSDWELEKLREIGDGNPSAGLRKLLEGSYNNMKATTIGIIKDIGKVVADSTPQIFAGIVKDYLGGGKKK